MTNDNKTALHRADDNEFLGYIVKDTTGWQAQTIFGYLIERTTTKTAAKKVLEEQGLTYLMGIWQYYDKDEHGWFPCVLKEANKQRVTVIRTNHMGYQDPEDFKIVTLVSPTENTLIKSSQFIMQKTIHTAESPYGRYKVVDMTYNGRPARMLFGNRASPQSGVAKDDEPELLFDYNQRFLEMIMSQQPKRILVIGGGAFMLPTAAFHQFPKLRIDVVEIDPLLVQIAQDFFDLPDDKRLRVHAMDGAEFIERSKERYDMIIVDAFSGFTVPGVLINESAAKQYARHLKRSGYVAINFISEYKPRHSDLAHTIVRNFSPAYPNIALYPADPEYITGEQQNLLFVGSRAPLGFAYLQSDEIVLLP